MTAQPKFASGLHAEEHQAINDALNGLRTLEREEVQYAADQQRKLAEEALQKLRSLEPRIARLQANQSAEGS